MSYKKFDYDNDIFYFRIKLYLEQFFKDFKFE